jgi:GNAT superfamily N-acetyltransferase
MRILTYDELPTKWEASRLVLSLSAFSGNAFPRALIDRLRPRAAWWPDYLAVYAVEGADVLGQVIVLRLRYQFPHGTETVSGLASITTRQDRSRGGIARALIDEVERRERDAGIRYSTLWTNPSWYAHSLYERLGYRDLYQYPWAVRAVGSYRRPRSRGGLVRPGRSTDLDEIDRFHDGLRQNRWGFGARGDGYLRFFASQGLDPGKELLVARRAGQLVGYARYDLNLRRMICGELLGASLGVRLQLIGEIERRARGLPVAFQHSVIPDTPSAFRGARYTRADRGWWVLMGRPLDEEITETESREAFGVGDPRFACYSGDRF